MNKKNPYKTILIVLILLVIGVGVYFGITFYKASLNKAEPIVTNPKTSKTAFQQRVSTSTNVEDPQIGIFTNSPVENTTTNQTPSDTVLKQRLVQLWKEPVSGFDFVYKDIEVTSTSSSIVAKPVVVAATTTSASTTIRSIDEKKEVVKKPVVEATTTPVIIYKKTIFKNQEFAYLWDRSTGHIYENLSSSTDVFKLSNFTLPRIQEAFFINPTTVVVRGVSSDNESITSRAIKLYKETSTSTIYSTNIKNLSINSEHISVLPNTGTLFYVVSKTGRGVSVNPDGSNLNTVINTSLTEWLYQYVNKDLVSLTTKPSAYFPGYLFFVKTNGTGNNEYILGGKYGLTTLVSPDGTKIIYNEIINDRLESFLFDVKTKKNIRLTQATLSEKCVWNKESTFVFCGIPQKLPNAPYPDAWYQNKTSFSDNIWSINASTGEFSVVVPLQDQLTTPIDVLSIKISSTGKYLLFQDRYSLTLWKYEL